MMKKVQYPPKSKWVLRVLSLGYQIIGTAPRTVALCRRYFGTRSKSQHDTASSLEEPRKNARIRTNPVKIQMLSSSLLSQVFGESAASTDSNQQTEPTKMKEIIDHLKTHGLWDKVEEGSLLPDVDFKLPKLHGANLDEHFRTIALKQSKPYVEMAKELASCNLPPAPTSWNYECGWTKYYPDGSWEKVDFPPERALVFDVEVLVTESQMPTLATAVSSVAWYSWCSKYLVESQMTVNQSAFSNDLIPMETKFGQTKSPSGKWEPRLIVGHNVSYDRARIKEQYYVKGTLLRFLDTMSLHIAASGLTGLQRALLMSERTGSKRKKVEEAKTKYLYRGPLPKDWMKISCMNNLAEVYQLYCKGSPLKKEERDIFVKGSMADVKENFQQLMSYCSRDVKATKEIVSVLLPIFLKRCPHPVTFAGMLEMGSSYLPVNKNWDIYLENSQTAHDNLDQELKQLLMRLANDACEHLHDDKFKLDPWLWNLDWSVKERKTKCIPPSKKKIGGKGESIKESIVPSESWNHQTVANEAVCYDEDEPLEDTVLVKNLLDTAKHLYVRKPNVAGYPIWYSDLCPKYAGGDPSWKPGPTLISTQMQITPRLLRLTWDGYPLHFSKKNGWGYLVPGKPLSVVNDEFKDFPLSVVETISPCLKIRKTTEDSAPNGINLDAVWEQIMDGVADPMEESHFWSAVNNENDNKRKRNDSKVPKVGPAHHHGNGPFVDEDVPGCWFFRLPHKDGPSNRVGNPLAKDFLNKIEDGTLFSIAGEHADWALKMNKMTSYWRNAHKRIMSQLVVWLKKNEHPKGVTRNEKFDENEQYGAILPLIVTAGTVTRRAVEATWLTASNAYVDRVGSELKAMIQSFPGYHFVGADVDSQELWIAALLGDCHFSGIHGSTALGWMTLQGKKSSGTDMHSKTASAVGISRDQAKVMNYGRIYGAGQQFASRLLIQFNHRLTLDEAKSRAQSMYAATKGVRGYLLNEEGEQLLANYNVTSNHRPSKYTSAKPKKTILSRKELNRILRSSESRLDAQDVTRKTIWMGGTESAMFNKLEDIAMSPEPETPVLGVKISRALEPAYVIDNFMTSRVNWVVQSSAVDYLHLMLVAMRWLFDVYSIDGRFCISIHDEVRYLVKSEDRYRAALALQITNLWTRAMFAYALGMKDLPQCVAFFSSVDIDTVLRKEVHLDCKTPSNIHGLEKGYGIPPGEAMDIYAILEKTKSSLL